MRICSIVLVAAAILPVFLSTSSVRAQRTPNYPPFTLVMQTTNYDAQGEALSTRTSTSYHSVSGDWRTVGIYGGYEMAGVYRRGRGVYTSNARSGVLLKNSDHAPGCPLRTAEQLRRDPKFVRTETVLNFKAYVLGQRYPPGFLVENYFVPELGGGTPVKRTYVFDDGRKIVEEPISIMLAEPAPTDIGGPDYPVIEQVPVFNKELAKKIISKPEPIYPQEALLREISGIVHVSVVVDESGRVLSASSNAVLPFLNEAAVEAAYQAWFSPTVCNGRPVMARGIITYQFAPRLLAKN